MGANQRIQSGKSGAFTHGMTREWDLRERTMQFAVAVFKFCRTLPRTDETRDVARQLRRSSSSVAANYRSSLRAQSDGVFAAKTAIVIEEADESGFWLELLISIEVTESAEASTLLQESNELVAIFTASKKKVCARLATKKAKRSG